MTGRRTLAVSSGAAAIALALDACGVTAGDEVLVPAFNCRAMREPAWLHGAKNVLYHISADLSINLEDLVRRITPATRAVVAAHYFGFPQDLSSLRKLCDEYGIALIEDCAHTLLRRGGDGYVGSYGHYVVGSATKFFPVNDGGFLAMDDGRVTPDLNVPSLKRDIRSAWNAVEVAVGFGRLPGFAPLLRPLYALRHAAKRVMTTPTVSSDDGRSRENQLLYVRRSVYREPMSRASRAMVARYSLDRAAERRRRNYRTLAEISSQLRHARPLFPTLSERVVPYMLPLVVDDHQTQFPRLKAIGMPMYRWEDCGASDCPVSADYSNSLIQIPCHEQLWDAEISRISQMLESCLD